MLTAKNYVPGILNMVGMQIIWLKLELEFQSVPRTKKLERENKNIVLSLRHKYYYTLGGVPLKVNTFEDKKY